MLDNRSNREDGRALTFITAVRRPTWPNGAPDAQGVLIDLEPRAATFVLEDGSSLTYDLAELRAALQDTTATTIRRAA